MNMGNQVQFHDFSPRITPNNGTLCELHHSELQRRQWRWMISRDEFQEEKLIFVFVLKRGPVGLRGPLGPPGAAGVPGVDGIDVSFFSF